MQIIDPGPHLLKGDSKRYPHGHDAAMRLAKTIVHYDGEPVYVKSTWDNTLMVIWRMKEGMPDFVVDANDSRLDIASPRMGFLSYGGEAYYAMRNPIRTQRQGLDITRLNFQRLRQRDVLRFNVDTDLLYGFRKMLSNEYPSVEEAASSRHSEPFGKTWALRNIGSKKVKLLYHRSEAVGFYDKEGRTFVFEKGLATRLRIRSLNDIISKQQGVSYAILAR